MIKKQYILLIFAFFVLHACNTDDLEVANGNAISSGTFPGSTAELNSAINGTYSPLQSQGLYGRYLTYMMDYMAGDEAYVGNRGTGDLRDFLEYTFTAANNDIYLYWKNAYNGISRANFILDRTDKINAFSNAELSQVDKDDAIGQAKFLRAFYYFLLVERFGDIPLYTTANADYNGAPKSPKADVYALIISDLQDASTKLKPKSSAEAGRATKGAADALLGKLYLFQNDYTNAKTAFEKVITSGEYALTANYFDNFESVNENNSESVFEVQFDYGGGGAWGYVDWGGQDNGDSETSFRSIEYGGLGGFHNNDPSHSLVNEYENEVSTLIDFNATLTDATTGEHNGNFPITINADVNGLWDGNKFVTTESGVYLLSITAPASNTFMPRLDADDNVVGGMFLKINGETTYNLAPGAINITNFIEIKTGDEIEVIYDFVDAFNIDLNFILKNKFLDARLANFYFTRSTHSSGTVGNIAPAEAPGYWRKYQKSYNQGNDGAGLSDINHRVIRYADVLLMAAEVLNQTGGTIDGKDAVGFMNVVRDRAGMPNYGTSAMDVIYPVTNPAEIFTAIVHERRIELAGEENRFPDLLRWGMANTITGFVTGKHELFPIPQKEFDTNANLSIADQNPGY